MIMVSLIIVLKEYKEELKVIFSSIYILTRDTLENLTIFPILIFR